MKEIKNQIEKIKRIKGGLDQKKTLRGTTSMKEPKKPKKVLWNCTDVSGYTSGGTPEPCQLLPEKQPGTIVPCNFPENSIPIDEVKLQRCYSRRRLM
uniref:Uncharacterized protein n=1 Tax=Brassica oleracea var. oleracea TaxID=109376 RepID=A0A0D2ZS33_BRAOL